VGGERSSVPDGELPEVVDRQKVAEQEAQNTLRQYDLMSGMIGEATTSGRFRLRPSALLDLHREALQGLSQEAGMFRRQPVRIQKAQHLPPRWEKVPRLIDDMCDYVNDTAEGTALHLSAFVMWRLNWIHPFVDGNGRTSRAASYLVLCAKLGYALPGERTIPELIAERRDPYYDALEACDQAFSSVADQRSPPMTVSTMEDLLQSLLARQLTQIVTDAGGSLD